jgi:serine/threonine-protein kinase
MVRIPDDDLTIGPPSPMGGLGESGADRHADMTAAASNRFAPGAIIAGRYRLVALLGRGGMGEVYRADDLTLDQPVALKFLPEGVGGDPPKLAQFHNELRTARLVSHKNVVRLYDLGEAQGRRFLTMEYIDGEDLASLLRRIGRIPQDKAIELARQLCAGIAAAHERGVLHRDLKPANVMIDGEGNVRITDFGIAGTAATAARPATNVATFAGTPQYMAPEQLAGQPASTRSDIYGLGLILFEIFTGRRAIDAKSLTDLKHWHDTGGLTTPAMLVPDLDPAVERVILRCLEKDPLQRPGSALAVAASLPGGDPLAAALAAGETPSPELLVAAGETEALGVGIGLAGVAAVVVALAILIAIAPRLSVSGLVPLDKPPAVLADRARQILNSFGYTDSVADTAYDMTISQTFLRWAAANDQRVNRWDVLKTGSPPALVFWHRTSPRPMAPLRPSAYLTNNDPPLTVSGMTVLILDTLGRAIEFQAVPPQINSDDTPAAPPRWEALFDAAGLAMASFTAVAPQWSPRDFADTRAAWEGPLHDHPEYRVRVEAAAFRGRPVSMFVLGPWARPTRMAPVPRSTAQIVLAAFVAIVVVALVLAALLIARYNLRAQRADRRGAARLAVFVMIGYASLWVISGHHVADVAQEVGIFTRSYGSVLMAACLLWVIYLALEPYVRRFWPDGILGWTRLLSGHVRDPRVGRDVLLGCVVASGVAVLQAGFMALPPLVGRTPPIPSLGSSVNALISLPLLASNIFDVVIGGLFSALFVILGYVLLRLILRRTPLAIAALMIVLGFVNAQRVLESGAPVWIGVIYQLLLISTIVFIVVRFGLLVTAVSAAVGNILAATPLTFSMTHWTATTSNLALAVVIGLTMFGFYASRAGQPLLGNLEVKS